MWKGLAGRIVQQCLTTLIILETIQVKNKKLQCILYTQTMEYFTDIVNLVLSIWAHVMSGNETCKM